MRPLVAHVDRLQRLAVFDAAARTGSFTAAAAQLCTSQPAATRQIRELEQALGITLFHRTANRSSLTAAGQQLAEAVDSGFSVIERRLAAIRDPNPTFVLATPAGFAQQLLVPVLDGLHDELPDVDIRLWLYDRDHDLDAGTYDLAIRVGQGGWERMEDVELFAERVVPVVSRPLAERLGLHEGSTAEEIRSAPLLHMESNDRPWMSWAEWLDAFDLELTSGRRRLIHNSYPIVIQRALAGDGVALGWRNVIEQLLDDGLLLTIGPEVRSKRSYRLTWPSADGPDERLSRAIDWIVATVAPVR